MKKAQETKTFDLDKRLFWDVELPTPEQFDSHYFFVIERVLMRGKADDFAKILKYYNRSQIKEVVLKSRQISNKSRQFFGCFLKINKNQLCTPERSNQTLWHY
jgi:hypothetical protein